ncbi:citrate lyase subunit gamma (acyl carrier protein) [Sphaerochaeta associata]|uniref:Citrate lyase acyl carrier protein n=1 Tax=Sphaerochaeta associata TaxID=1129264 RepID=A0ABY4DEA5_9SPIR|nr:citrate lyase acyl carrier protein [Sphaerochaeta associata]UOM51838.1 citrate lyase acyl carrier protein [Sphaerochaeta associata]SMP61005.1 citrate lyase subunit gamma (acyl carrier protein) [Sphaerochaeta associata]
MSGVSAGKAQKGDVLVTISEPESDLRLTVTSTVQGLYGRRIEAVCKELLDDLHIVKGHFEVVDQQAFDCVIRARLRCAIARMGGLL